MKIEDVLRATLSSLGRDETALRSLAEGVLGIVQRKLAEQDFRAIYGTSASLDEGREERPSPAGWAESVTSVLDVATGATRGVLDLVFEDRGAKDSERSTAEILESLTDAERHTLVVEILKRFRDGRQ